MFYELINPSDKITFEAPNYESALLATLMVGKGAYGADPIDDSGDVIEGEEDVPIFFLGGLDEFVAERNISLKDIKAQYHDDIVLTLKSFCTGSMNERTLFDAALKAITDDDARKEFIANWDDKQRSSMNQITNRAHALASSMEDGKT